VEVPFDVAERVAGESKWSIWGLARYSMRNLISFSALPLKAVAATGFATLFFAAGLAVQTLYRYVAGHAVSGFTTVILLQLMLGGLLLTSIGVVALYVAEIYNEVKHRPVFLVRRERPEARARVSEGVARSATEPRQAPPPRA
jgi:dolichol-phosphate mannosyltransferase